jgi:hypothetical protein
MRYADKEGIECMGWIGKDMDMKKSFHKMCVEKKNFFER